MTVALSIPYGSRIVPRTRVQTLMMQLDPMLRALWAAPAGRDFKNSVARVAEQFPQARDYFDIRLQRDDDYFALKDELLFLEKDLIESLGFVSPMGAAHEIDLREYGELLLPEIHKLLRYGACGRYSLDFLKSRQAQQMHFLADALVEHGFFVEGPTRPPAAPLPAGVYRLQHAGLLFRGREAGLLVDPHLHSGYEPPGLEAGFTRAALEGQVDAIAISHSHGDHWDPTALLQFPPDTPIITPRVPRPSLVCEDMAAKLRGLGFENVHDPPWWAEPLRFGDIHVHPLPFYGEQALRHGLARDPDLRNWGATYGVRTPDYAAWFLIDSGDDETGAMREVAAGAVERLGSLDLLLSNLQVFTMYQPVYINGGKNWLSLTNRQQAGFEAMKEHRLTLGVEGVAELCALTGAERVAAYAHWWGDPGGAPPRNEIALLEALAGELSARRSRAQILDWRIGDGWAAGPDGFDIVRDAMRAEPFGANLPAALG